MQLGFFDLEKRYEQLSKLKDPLEELNRMIDWNLFADLLRETTSKPRKSAAGRKPFDRVMLFKMLLLQRMHNLSDDRLEYQVRDRLSFMRFLGLGLAGVVPDAKTMWAFREELKGNQLIERLFARFDECLRELDVELKSGQIIDATFVTVPKQRNTREENEIIKEGAVPIEWGQNPHKLAQKDIDARWTKKNDESFYGYKDHVNVDQGTKLITAWEVTSAEIHDSQVLAEVLQSSEVGGTDVYAESPVPDKRWTWPLFNKEWPIGGSLGVGASVDYVFGSNEWPKLDFKPVEFDSTKFMSDLYSDKAKSGSGKDKESKGKWGEKNSKAADPPPKKPPVGSAKPGKGATPPPAKSKVQPGGGGTGAKPVDPNELLRRVTALLKKE